MVLGSSVDISAPIRRRGSCSVPQLPMNIAQDPVTVRLVSAESNDWPWRAKRSTLIAYSGAVGMREEGSVEADTSDPRGHRAKPHYKM